MKTLTQEKKLCMKNKSSEQKVKKVHLLVYSCRGCFNLPTIY